jgi:hypothetical protein
MTQRGEASGEKPQSSDPHQVAHANGVERALPRFVGGRQREQVVPLEWPIEYDGKVWDKIRVKRVTVAEMSAYLEALKDDANAPVPLFDAPRQVLDALDADDDETLSKVAADFFPRRWRAANEQAQPVGADTAQSSPPSSAGPGKS